MAAKDTKPAVETVTVKVDGRPVEVPRMTPNWEGKPEPTTVLQACKQAGIEIPHYCYHPKLCLLYTSPSPRDATLSRMPSSA